MTISPNETSRSRIGISPLHTVVKKTLPRIEKYGVALFHAFGGKLFVKEMRFQSKSKAGTQSSRIRKPEIYSSSLHAGARNILMSYQHTPGGPSAINFLVAPAILSLKAVLMIG